MTRKIVNPPPPSIKDENGQYQKAEPVVIATSPAADISIDVLMQRGLSTIERILQACSIDASGGRPSRASVMNLKDCMVMLESLKKRESELLDSMSEEDLEKVINK